MRRAFEHKARGVEGFRPGVRIAEVQFAFVPATRGPHGPAMPVNQSDPQAPIMQQACRDRAGDAGTDDRSVARLHQTGPGRCTGICCVTNIDVAFSTHIRYAIPAWKTHMTDVTVCIPAYRSERFIHKTLRSVQEQTFRDIAVHIAIEPAGEEPLRACEPFLEDRRFTATVNPEVLGWDRNIRGLLAGVTTPFFQVLPHDDVLHPQYIEALVGVLGKNPAASVAYADMHVFGHDTARKSMPLAEGRSVPERIVSFFLAGAEAVPWRGVARAEALAGEQFPTNEHMGFAVECEWALHLLLRGSPCRIARPLYFKRSYEPKPTTVSRVWTYGFSKERLKAALEHHRKSMLDRIHRAARTADANPLAILACEAAMLRRYMAFSHGRFAYEDQRLERANGLLREECVEDPRSLTRIQAMVRLALSRNELVLKHPDEAERLARASIDADSGQWESHVHLGTMLLKRGEFHEALECVMRACKLAPHAAPVNKLLRACEAQVNETYSASA